MSVFSKPKVKTCSHCESYHAIKDDLCGNCLMISPEKREIEKKFKTTLVDNKRKADEAAKKAYIDSLRELNKAEAESVTNDTFDKNESRSASLGR